MFNRTCCFDDEIPEKIPKLDSVKVEPSPKPANDSIKEARVKLGKQKSVENRKVLRELSAEQGAKTVEEELVLVRSVISPSMETRIKNSESLRTRSVSPSQLEPSTHVYTR